MKRVEVVSRGSVKVTPFILDEFLPEHTAEEEKKVGKKTLIKLAEELDLEYDAPKIRFAKKMINAYIKKSENGY